MTRQIDRWKRWLICLSAVLVFASFTAHMAVAQDRALIIAIDSYADPRLSGLPNSLAENDARSIEKVLIEKLGYKKEDIKVLKNRQATRSAILGAIETWINPTDPKAPKTVGQTSQLVGLDESGALSGNTSKKRKKRRVRKKYVPPPKVYRSYIYFSGYGYFRNDVDGDEKDGKDEALLPFDAKVVEGSGSAVVQGAILDDDLADLLGKVSRRHVTLVLDTSFSGVFTRSSSPADRAVLNSRAPALPGAVKNLMQPGGDLHKDEGAFLDVAIPSGSLTVWSAVSPTQTALVAGPDDKPQGLFSLLYTEGLSEGMADANKNGIISNAELLRHVSRGSTAYCSASKDRCEMGLRPRLDPPRAFGKAAWVDRKKVTRAREQRLSVNRLADFIGSQPDNNIQVQQFPPSPLTLGETDIRYEVRSPTSAFLVLLNLTEDGRLFQLYPNQHAGKDKDGFAGLLAANAPLSVPDKTSGMKFAATEPGKGHIIAIVTPDPVKFDEAITDRVIPAVSPKEAVKVYLARLSAGLHYPANTRSVQTNTATSRWSVVTLPYEIVAPKKKKPAAKKAAKKKSAN
ncbi:MAG: DUF4384 domain-containing protein [Hyphomicrobiaceae bacterium]|nr:DUF4384 domain-containing protein [Hyphomicrobiaceae bacterium]